MFLWSWSAISKFKVSKEVDVCGPTLLVEVRGCGDKVDTFCEEVRPRPQTTSSSTLEVVPHCKAVQVYAPSKLPTSKDKLDPLATFARSPSAFAEVFLPQHLVLFPASRSAFEVFPQARKRSKEISPRISRSVKSSRSFQAEKKRSLPVKASGVSPKKKSKLKFITFAKKNWHPVWSFQNQIMKSVRSPCVHGSEVTKTNEVRGPKHWSEKHGSSASTFLKFNPEVSWSSRKTK